MAGTFSWIPDYGFEQESKANVSTVKFGDGYEQRRAEGINVIQNSWSLTFDKRSSATIQAIQGFLLSKKGLESFDFVAPNGVTYKVRTDGETICKVVDSDVGVKTLTTTFKQVFE